MRRRFFQPSVYYEGLSVATKNPTATVIIMIVESQSQSPEAHSRPIFAVVVGLKARALVRLLLASLKFPVFSSVEFFVFDK